MGRVPPSRPLTPAERVIADALAGPAVTNREIATTLGISSLTVKNHIERIALKLPGDLPAKMRVTLWARGAPAHLLGQP